MANPMKSVKMIGRRIGRSMLKMNKREKTRRRKAKRYFGEEPKIVENPGKKEERIIPEKSEPKTDTEEIIEEANEEIF